MSDTTKSFTSVEDSELHSIKDRAHLFDLVYDAPCYISFFTGQNGQGAALRETLIVPKRDHNDNVLYNMAMRKAKKLGATSWMVFKPMGVPHNVYYGQFGDESRLDFMEAVSDLVVTDPSANWDAANPQSPPQRKEL